MSDAWTAADDALLRDMRAAGKTAREIAAALGRTKMAVYLRERRLARGVGPAQQETLSGDLLTMEQLFRRGLSCRKIAAETGWSTPTVARSLALLGLRKRGRPVAKRKPKKRAAKAAPVALAPVALQPPVINWEMALAGRRFEDKRPRFIQNFSGTQSQPAQRAA